MHHINLVVQMIQDLLFYLSTWQKAVKLCWIPSHVGIPSNEKADALAWYAILSTAHQPCFSHSSHWILPLLQNSSITSCHSPSHLYAPHAVFLLYSHISYYPAPSLQNPMPLIFFFILHSLTPNLLNILLKSPTFSTDNLFSFLRWITALHMI